ncbi:hypothetical protein [Arcicella aurantiaca]|nr:hypothetical protein [Arcicella aurantiaca]
MVLVIAVFGYSLYERIQEKTSGMKGKLEEANKLFDSMRKRRKVQFIGDAKRGYIMFDNSNTTLYFKKLEDTNNIAYLLQKVDSILAIQQFNHIKKY